MQQLVTLTLVTICTLPWFQEDGGQYEVVCATQTVYKVQATVARALAMPENAFDLRYCISIQSLVLCSCVILYSTIQPVYCVLLILCIHHCNVNYANMKFARKAKHP